MMCLRFASRMVSDDAVALYVELESGSKGLVKVLSLYYVYVDVVMVNTRCL